jgi:hypothetical protein
MQMPAEGQTDGAQSRNAPRARLGRRRLLGASIAVLSLALARPLRAATRDDNVIVTTGRLVVEHELVVRGVLSIAPGAGITVAAGAVLRLLGDLVAPTAPVFFGPGIVDLTGSRVMAARPEWWGASPNDPSVDCEPALVKALQAHIAVELAAGDYYLSRSLRIAGTNRRLSGLGRAKDARGSRLVLQSEDGAVVQLGNDAPPRTINDYARGIDLRNLELARDRPPRPGRDGTDAATGLRIRHVLDTSCDGLRASEHAIGFDIKGAVRSYLRDCIAFRSAPAAAGAPDFFVGFLLDGRRPPIATGANASLYIIDCNASLGGRPALATSVGCRLVGAMSDTFLVRFETAALATGLELDGEVNATADAPPHNVQIDLHIDSPVLDQCTVTGIAIARMGADAMIDIRAPYVGLGSARATAMSIRQSGGAISLVGGQFVAPASFGDGAGILIDTSSGVTLTSTKILGLSRPAVLRNCRSSHLDLAVGTAGRDWPQPAIRLVACRLVHIEPRLFGASGSYAAAVELDAASDEIGIETAGIDRARLAGPVIRRSGSAGSRYGSSYWFGPTG